MKPYGIRPKDNDCCYGHAKYGVRGFTARGVKRSRNRLIRKQTNKSRKAKIRQLKIEL